MAVGSSCIVLAAGKGTRMNSDLPKVLHRVCGQTLLERTLRAVFPHRPQEIVVVVGFGAELIEKELELIATLPEARGIAIVPVKQEQQRGTGDAASFGLTGCAPDTASIVILPGDVPLLNAEVLQPLFSEVTTGLRVLSCKHPQPTGFGRIVRDAHGVLQAIVEQTDATEEQLQINEINTGIYQVHPQLLKAGLASLEPKNAQGELYLTDIIAYAVAKGAKVEAMTTGDVLAVTGANTRVELSSLEQQRREQLVRAHQLAGVSFEDPQRTYIEEDVTIGQDTFIGANTRLLAGTRIGSRVVIEGDSRIEQSEIADECHLKLACYIDQSRVGPRVSLGPFAQLRPGTVLEADVKVGNFVEIKNATLAEGAKANHLAYIGDAEVGAQSNIGAGTIFCNYDGVRKHRSTLGKGVFVGSNSTLVSPVTLGEGAYIAAGSTITKNVNAGALGIGRSRQTQLEDWVAKRSAAETKKRSES